MTQSHDQFGAYLVRANLVSGKEINEALRQQTILGGRLGTNLIETGAVSLDQLEQHLCAFYKLPAVPEQAYTELNPRLLKTVPRRLIEKYRFLPLARTDRGLQIVTMDPRDERMLEDLSTTLGVKIEPLVASEVRVLFYLDYYFKIPVEIRYRSLFFHYRKNRSLKKETPFTPGPASRDQELETLGFQPLQKGQELTDDGFEDYLLRQTIARESVAAQPPPPAPPVEAIEAQAAEFAAPAELPDLSSKNLAQEFFPSGQEISIEQLEETLEKINDRNQVAALALRFARQFTTSTVLFVIHANLVSGWEGSGKKLSRSQLRSWVFPLAGESVFKTLSETRNHFYGRLSDSPINEQLLASLGLARETPLLLVPVFVKKRLVNLVLGESGAKALPQPSINSILGLARWLGKAYEKIIVQRKKDFHEGLE